jgi:hypothetical protein
MNSSLLQLVRRGFFMALIGVMVLGLNPVAQAQWVPPTQNPPNGNVPGPVWLNPPTAQNGFLNLSTDHNPAINAVTSNTTGIIAVGQEYGLVATGTTAGLRGIGTGAASYGVFGQSQDGGYAAGFDGPTVMLPQDESRNAANQGAIFYQSNEDANSVYFCSLEGGCESSNDWENLIYGAFERDDNTIRLARPGYTLNGPANQPFYINGDQGVQVRFNSAGDDGTFSINNGNNDTIFAVEEDGDVAVGGDIRLSSGSTLTLGGETIDSWSDIAEGTVTQAPVEDDDPITSSSGAAGTLDDAYNSGGAGNGRTIVADAGAVSVIAANNNGFEVSNTSASAYAGFFSTSGAQGRAVYGIATSTDIEALNYGGYFTSNGGNGVGVYGRTQNSGATAVSGYAQNAGIAGQFISEEGFGIFANGSTAVSAQGFGTGLDAVCNGDDCVAVRADTSNGTGDTIGLLASATSGFAAQFIGQEVVVGPQSDSMNTERINQEGDLFVARNLEVDGVICLANDCRAEWPTGDGATALWAFNDNNVLYPTDTTSVLVGNSSEGNDTGLLIHGDSGDKTSIQAYTLGDTNSLHINPEGSNVIIGDQGSLSIDVATGVGDLFVSRHLEVEGSICFKGTGGCASSWPSGGGGGSVWESSGDPENIYEDDVAVIVGDGAEGETLANEAFASGAMGVGDLFVADELGVETRIVTDGDLHVDGNLTLGNSEGTSSIALNGYLSSEFPIIFEGPADDDNEVTLAIDEPAGDVQVYFPNQAGYIPLRSEIKIESNETVTYEDDEPFVVGATLSETIDSADFAAGGMEVGDLFVNSELGVEGAIYTDTYYVAGTGLIVSDDDIIDSNGNLTIGSANDNVNITMGGDPGDWFTVDSNVFIVDSGGDTASFGMNPTGARRVEIDGSDAVGGLYVSTTGTDVTSYFSGTGNSTNTTETYAFGTNSYALYANSTEYVGVYAGNNSLTQPALIASSADGVTSQSAQFLNGFVEIGSGGTNSIADDGGELYVTGDAEFDGYVYLGDGDDRVCINLSTCSSYPLEVGDDVSDGNGAHVTAGGTWTNGSSRTFKDRFVNLDKHEVLEKVLGLSVTGWHYKGTDEYHIGPVAEDFFAAFDTGLSNQYLAAGDMGGVALVSVQALAERVESLEQKVDQQEQLLNDLLQRVKQLENQ